ncbi:Brp/Blh family beta-carotene 15,15'-dioxygenase [Aquiflexum gelatinilyticum]|uniref:Brp/Blh family beta-carotene 15,15'-dioxygenase n=1 Tax=Aquiflexum gelatinilyticum TaxID=2961943 RepID=UPI0021692CF6|nr:Brp/Blh family beta-carotene 15,15'-dioxygenase [Aquiflexum gelatinilyticum]MCS4434682.1 Brp/Blh family beta-carotene 15,15'-dioxygenase [Aquiflexum gelatinilyticum]
MRGIETAGKIIGAALGISYLLFFEGNEMFQWICFALILISIGIPHGAIDHLLLNPVVGRKNLIRFIFKYLLIIAVYLAIWLIFPILALEAFLIMSAFHFGQSHFFKTRLNKFSSLTYISLGSFILSTILWGDFNYTQSILANIIDVRGLPQYGIFVIAFFWGLSATLIGVNLGEKGLILVLEISLLGLLLYQLPLLLGFIIYFGFWHSLPSMTEEFEALKDYLENQKLKNFIKKLLPFTSMSLIGIALILLFFYQMMEFDQLTLLFFILVSLISAPHIWYMNLFLEARKNQY